MPSADVTRRRTALIQRMRSQLAADGDPLGVLERAARELLREVPADIWCGVLLDPSTLLDTGGIHTNGFPETVMPQLFQIEHVEQDGVDNLRRLAGRAVSASLLSVSSGGDLANSRYFREILEPIRLADELRVLLRDEQRVWGLLVLCRERTSAPFTPDDLALAGGATRPATVALRRSLLVTGLETDAAPDVPGLLVLDEGGRVQWVSDTAKVWLDALPERGRSGSESLPYPVQAAVARARASADGYAVARLRARAGSWMAIHAMPVRGPSAVGTAVSIGPVQPGELASIVLHAYGLSPREHEIAQLVLLGRSTGEIARTLYITEDTIQDHLKAVFRKTGVHSRRELIGAVFARHYLPNLPAAPLTTDGRLLDGSQKAGMATRGGPSYGEGGRSDAPPVRNR